MAVADVTSLGSPTFKPVKRGQVTVPQNNGNGGGNLSGNSSSPLKVNLENRVQNSKQLELEQEGRELVNLKMLSDDLQVNEQVSGLGSTEDGLKAVMISRDKQSPTDFEVELLKVRPDGSTNTLFSSDTSATLQNDSSSSGGNLNIRGSLLDTQI